MSLVLSLSQWQEIFSHFERSGLTQRSFCQRHGLCLSTFQKWRKRVKDLFPVSAPADFVEVRLPHPQVVSSNSMAGNDKQGELVLELPYGVMLRFRGLRP